VPRAPRNEQEKWDAQVEAERQKLLKGPSSSRRKKKENLKPLTPAEALAAARAEIKKKLGKRPCPLSHKQFRLDIVYGLLGHPELGQHKGRRKAGRPAKERVETRKRVMTTPDRNARRSDAQRFSTASKRRRPNPPRGKAHAYNKYTKVRLDCGLDPNRFILIKNLNRHPAWDFQDKKKGSVRQTRNRCQVCRAMGKEWHKKYRGGTKEPPCAKFTCPCDQCPGGFCSMACFNIWHYDEEMPKIKD